MDAYPDPADSLQARLYESVVADRTEMKEIYNEILCDMNDFGAAMLATLARADTRNLPPELADLCRSINDARDGLVWKEVARLERLREASRDP